ncbi:MAG: 4Fe-4S dicluster domain-containing protein [Deltaproteobacteria bacterium]|nr:4Fe-4S dicluster domain-containing protein [Deltaproteobacteria bacterium]
MAHRTTRTEYKKLINRINRHPQGAPETELLYRILQMLFSKKEADLVARLPIKPISLKTAAGIWKMSEAAAKNILDNLCSRGIMLDMELNGRLEYTLPPPMAGFFEFSLMRITKDIDQKLLSELYYQYLNVEDDFVRELFGKGDTKLGRIFVNEPALPDDNSLHVLDYERSTEIIKSASHIGVGVCYCRHKMMHMKKACDAPLDVCMTLGTTASSLIRHNVIRQVDTAEALDILDLAYEHNLVQFGENVRSRVNFICHCCGCCCEALLAVKRFAVMNPVHTTNFIPQINLESCKGCGKCAKACPVEAIELTAKNDLKNQKRKQAKLDEQRCLGCGVCVRVCKSKSISLKPRKTRVLTPMNIAHKTVLMAIERGTFQHLIFDNRVMLSHRALATLLGVVLKLPPAKQILAAKQVRSRYLEAIIAMSNM